MVDAGFFFNQVKYRGSKDRVVEELLVFFAVSETSLFRRLCARRSNFVMGDQSILENLSRLNLEDVGQRFMPRLDNRILC
jgi:chorismate-pyruvate lyase